MKTLRRAILVPTLLLAAVVTAVLVLLARESALQARALARNADEVRTGTALAVALGAAMHEQEHRVALALSRPLPPAGVSLDEPAARIDVVMEALRALPLAPRAAAVFAQLEDARALTRTIGEDVLRARRLGDAPATARALEQWYLVSGRSDALLDDFNAYHLRLLDRTVADLQRRRERAAAAAGVALLLGVLLAAAFAVSIARTVVRPIAEMAAAAERITATGPPARIGDPGRRDEIGALARSFERMTERLVSANARLSEAVRAREEFISIASHELKTPITPLQLRVQQLLRLLREAPGETVPRGDALHATRNLEKHVQSLARLVGNLLDVSQIASGGLPLRPEDATAGEVVREALGRVSDVLAAAGCAVRVEGTGDVQIRVDRPRIEQALVNLLVNAAKYAPGAPVVVRIDGSAGDVVVAVEDGGPGISAEERARIFDRFERGAGGRRDVSGLGLGLFIAREIVAAHGGELSVRGEPGQGATFVVRLPRPA